MHVPLFFIILLWKILSMRKHRIFVQMYGETENVHWPPGVGATNAILG